RCRGLPGGAQRHPLLARRRRVRPDGIRAEGHGARELARRQGAHGRAAAVLDRSGGQRRPVRARHRTLAQSHGPPPAIAAGVSTVRVLRLVLAYDGTAYAGWQVQPDAPRGGSVTRTSSTTARWRARFCGATPGTFGFRSTSARCGPDLAGCAAFTTSARFAPRLGGASARCVT